MARMHSGAKGKSGSKKPLKKIPSWTQYKDKDVEKLVVKSAKAGKSSSEIGLYLRDTYGISSIRVLSGKKVNTILKENSLTKKLPEDVLNLIKKLISINQHLDTNKHDYTAKRGMQLTVSKINRLIKYYKKSKKLAADWNLDLTRLKMYLE